MPHRSTVGNEDTELLPVQSTDGTTWLHIENQLAKYDEPAAGGVAALVM